MTKGKHLSKGVVERTFLLPRQLADQVREAAYKSGRSESALVREAIEHYLTSRTEPAPGGEPPA